MAQQSCFRLRPTRLILAGFHVLGIDYFFGDPIYIHTEAEFDRPTWVEKSIRQAREVVPKWIDAVLELYGAYLAIRDVLECKHP